jgi:hypothetical protein
MIITCNRNMINNNSSNRRTISSISSISSLGRTWQLRQPVFFGHLSIVHDNFLGISLCQISPWKPNFSFVDLEVNHHHHLLQLDSRRPHFLHPSLRGYMPPDTTARSVASQWHALAQHRADRGDPRTSSPGDGHPDPAPMKFGNRPGWHKGTRWEIGRGCMIYVCN